METPPTPPTPAEDPNYDPRTSADAQGERPRSGADFSRPDAGASSLPMAGSASRPAQPNPAAANPRPGGRPGGAAAEQVNKGLDKAAEKNGTAKALNDARKDVAAGTPKDEAAVKAGAVAGANAGADYLSGGVASKIRSSGKAGAKAGEIFDKAVGKSADASYTKLKKGVAVALGIAVPLAFLGIASIAGGFMSPSVKPTAQDSCLTDVYDPNLPNSANLSHEQAQTFKDIMQSAVDNNVGVNTAALATYVAYYEHGLTVGTAKGRANKIAGPFQQTVGWYQSDMRNAGGPDEQAAYQRTFGTAADPRLDTKKAAWFFMRSFKEVMQHGGLTKDGRAVHESVEEIRWALTQLMGTQAAANSDNWWREWNKADFSDRLNDPNVRLAMLILAHAVQGFAPSQAGVRDNLQVADTANAFRKWKAVAPIVRPMLQATARQREYQVGATQGAADVGAAAEGAALGGILPTAPLTTGSGSQAKGQGVFVLGDSISHSMQNDMEDAGYTVNAEDGRPASVEQWSLLKSSAAQGAEIWIIELGTNNDGNNPDAVKGWVNGVMKARNPLLPQTVYWVLPWRPSDYPKLGGTDKLNQAFNEEAARVNANGQWLYLLDWPDAVTALHGEKAWFEGDKMGIHPQSADGRDAFVTMMLSVTPGNLSADSNALDGCNGGSSTALTITDPSILAKKVILGYPTKEPFQDGPAPADADLWVPKVLARAESALVVPPCDLDSGPGCPSYCAQLAARLQGQSHSGKASAYLLMKERRMHGALVDSGDAKFRPPVGAMLFWDLRVGRSGHVATYVGDGMLVSNFKRGNGSWVMMMPAAKMFQEYDGYVGWALPPDSWKKSNKTYGIGGAVISSNAQ